MRLPRLRRHRERSPDGTMTLMEHLYELRRRLFIAVLGIFLGAVIGFIWYGYGIPAIGLPSLGDLLIAPYCAVPSPPRIEFDTQGSCTLLATGPFSILQVRLKAAVLAGAVLSAPVWLSQVWGFVTPALYSRERRFAITFVAVGSVLFIAGSVLAYVVIQEGLTVLLGFGADTASAWLSPDSYFPFLIAMLLIFGVSFELPLLLVMLNQVGVLSGAKLARWRRYSFFALVVFAGLVVPGNDPITMLALALSLCLLYELAAQIARVHDKRKAKRLAASGLGALSDDEASPLSQGQADGMAAGPIGSAGAVPRAEPLAERAAVRPDIGDAT